MPAAQASLKGPRARPANVRPCDDLLVATCCSIKVSWSSFYAGKPVLGLARPTGLFHPVREYLERPRVGMHATNRRHGFPPTSGGRQSHTRAVRFHGCLFSAVARIYRTWRKSRNCALIIGRPTRDQEIRALQIWVQPWFTDRLSDLKQAKMPRWRQKSSGSSKSPNWTQCHAADVDTIKPSSAEH